MSDLKKMTIKHSQWFAVKSFQLKYKIIVYKYEYDRFFIIFSKLIVVYWFIGLHVVNNFVCVLF